MNDTQLQTSSEISLNVYNCESIRVQVIVDQDTKTSTVEVDISLYSMQILTIVFGILVIVFTTCCAIVLCTCIFACLRSLLFRNRQIPLSYQARDRRRRLNEERKRQRERLVDTILKENACLKYSDANVKFDQNNCVICLEDYTQSDEVRILPGCNHVFHNNCVTEW